MRAIHFYLSLLFPIAGFAQQAIDSIHCDCSKALSIPIYKKHHHSAPKGRGAVMKIEHNGMKNGKYFDKEHNTIWYSITIPNDGLLTFDIIPDTLKDDYDFMLFKQGGRGTCDSIQAKTLLPMRANISHNAPATRGITGLSTHARFDFNKPGAHDHYSKALPVKFGDRYLLVLDNVYEKGKGHTVKFYFDFKLHGIVLDSSTGKPLTATITLTDLRSNTILSKSKSDSLNNGLFEFAVLLEDTLRWDLNLSVPGYFSESAVFTQKSIMALLQRPRVFKLRKIEKNRSFALKDINFFPNKDIFRPTSTPALQNLLHVMKDNGSLKILIEGHTNFDPNTTKEKDLKLSENRAMAVKKYLNDNGIDNDRIATRGYGSTRMIYPNPRTPEQQQMNMRVEIKVEDY
ncbi:MAG: OmpA family protein [Bacteroidetes bacterium]|nr:OmpA family protein [Bacteroidota bacterium]